ncbi:ComEA family DNA-binding protein [Cellulomonas sp. HD19AZ1]|uniref:ComEA family DNA-binding protein n=1 Tax=Cellulomonas sp. HD19AZ1 TaxID=2559593 RepID=UPI001F1165A9|nr:ComEA family DNA-binding protein [Cellulomonas sp. HD19AZ1]
MRPDRPPVPPDVARRLAALAAPPATPVADRRDTGWTPRPVAPEPWHPDVAAALADAADRVERPPAPHPPRTRWAPSWRTVGAAVLVLALAAGGVALRASTAPRGDAVELPVPGAAVPSGASGPAPAPDATAPGGVVVHVVGAVGTPGVVRLDAGARVADALAAAGGGTPDADLGALNLARTVTDGEQLRFPVVGEQLAAAPDGSAPDDGLVDLNRADATALQELPGVGPVLAGRIVEHRTRTPFTSVDELDDVPGIGPALMADLRARVRV